MPVIAAGGAGKAEDIYAAEYESRSQAVAIASILHYDACDKPGMTDSEYSEEGNTEFLHRRIGFNKIKGCTIEKIKAYLCKENVSCRMTSRACNEV